MNRKKRIYEKLSNNLKDFSIIIEDNSILHKNHNNFSGNDETHIQIKLKPNIKKNYNRLKLHRLINKILSDEFSNGLHALEINIIN